VFGRDAAQPRLSPGSSMFGEILNVCPAQRQGDTAR
jgi:hypothetical protein